MKRFVLSVPLSTEEKANLTHMMVSELQGCENAAEFVRLLLWREWNRRHRLGKPKASDYQSAFRKGRPKAESPVSR